MFVVPSSTREQAKVGPEFVTVKLSLTLLTVKTVPFAGLFSVTAGAMVSTVKALVWLLAVLLEASLQLVYQVCDPSARPVTCQFVRVPFETDALDMFVVPSRTREQAKVGPEFVTVKLRLTVVTLKKVPLAGELRVTVTEPGVTMVRLFELPVLPAAVELNGVTRHCHASPAAKSAETVTFLLFWYKALTSYEDRV
jgi:hypothetical protein